MEQVSELCRIGVGVDKRHGLGQALERLLALALGGVGRREIAKKRGALGAQCRRLRQSSRCLVPDGRPVAALDGGLRREPMEDTALGAGEGLVADEVVEASSKPKGDHLKRAQGRTDQTRLDLTDEALG